MEASPTKVTWAALQCWVEEGEVLVEVGVGLEVEVATRSAAPAAINLPLVVATSLAEVISQAGVTSRHLVSRGLAGEGGTSRQLWAREDGRRQHRSLQLAGEARTLVEVAETLAHVAQTGRLSESLFVLVLYQRGVSPLENILLYFTI